MSTKNNKISHNPLITIHNFEARNIYMYWDDEQIDVRTFTLTLAYYTL